MNHVIALAAGFLLDLIIGDPRWLYHPVCVIGNLISLLEKRIRKVFPKTHKGELLGGTLEVLLVCLFSFGVPFLVLYVLYRFCYPAGLALEIFWCSQLLAAKSLKIESMKVHHALLYEGIEKARYEVSMIVGRDTQNLTEEEVAKAAIETIAENTSDGVTAPAFYMIFGGVPLMFLYKGINTMDSMLGYKNEKYLYFGRCAAKLDDVVNYIPARISGILMLISTIFCSLDSKQALKIYRRDRHNHKSPNAAQTESVMAGALNAQLAGSMWYFGEFYQKQSIGDENRKIEAEDIKRANHLAYITDVLTVLLFVGIRFIIVQLLHI